MRFIYQTDRQFDGIKSAHEWCYFLSLNCHLAWWFNESRFTHQQMIDDFKHYLDTPEADVEGDGTISNPQLVCDYVAGPGRVKYLGKFDPDVNIGAFQFAIGCFHRDGADFNHFVAISPSKKVVYDPWSADGSRSVKEGKLIGIRLFEVLK